MKNHAELLELTHKTNNKLAKFERQTVKV